MSDFIKQIETQELIDKLIKNGYADLVEAFLMNENKVTTKKGRINKSGFCRILGWKSKKLEDAIKECQDILKPEDIVEESTKEADEEIRNNRNQASVIN